jgi:hypothetical protein
MSDIDQEFGPLIQALGGALVNYIPEHFKSAYCIVEQATAHARGRLGYQIGSKDHPNDGTKRPSPELHEAAHAIERHFRKRGTPFPRLEMKVSADDGGWKFAIDLTYDDTRVETDEAEEAKWQAVYAAREKLYETHIGKIPEYIQKMMNLTGVWPGGGLFQIASDKLGGACVTSSFGLSNVDMPTSCTAKNSSQEKSGDTYSFSSTLEGRTPRWVPTDLAGYGYEILLLTKNAEPWAANPIAWVINAEILNDVDLLDRVDEMGGVTVEDLALGDGRRADFFIERAAAPLPDRCQLPNGTMNLLVATRITREEMKFGIEKGRPALRERLTKAGIGQLSDLDRRSAV